MRVRVRVRGSEEERSNVSTELFGERGEDAAVDKGDW